MDSKATATAVAVVTTVCGFEIVQNGGITKCGKPGAGQWQNVDLCAEHLAYAQSFRPGESKVGNTVKPGAELSKAIETFQSGKGGSLKAAKPGSLARLAKKQKGQGRADAIKKAKAEALAAKRIEANRGGETVDEATAKRVKAQQAKAAAVEAELATNATLKARIKELEKALKHEHDAKIHNANAAELWMNRWTELNTKKPVVTTALTMEVVTAGLRKLIENYPAYKGKHISNIFWKASWRVKGNMPISERQYNAIVNMTKEQPERYMALFAA